MDPSNSPGWTLADVLFPPECIVLQDTGPKYNGKVFSYWDMDGHLQYAGTQSLADRLQDLIEGQTFDDELWRY